MQIDFHHAVTYILARWAEFSKKEARTIAHAAQYVDDATFHGPLYFEEGQIFFRTASAHEPLSWENGKPDDNVLTWVPFHFLPGNGGHAANSDDIPPFADRMVCLKNSIVAQDMVNSFLNMEHDEESLHRLGIIIHVYADTWAHAGFAGIRNEINTIKTIDDKDPETGVLNRLKNKFGDLFEEVQSKFLDNFPLGHAAALTFPDLPFNNWSYTNHAGKTIERENYVEFIDASKEIIKTLRRFRNGNPNAHQQGLDGQQEEILLSGFLAINDNDAYLRHKEWLRRIRSGEVPGAEDAELDYFPTGRNSWMNQALGQADIDVIDGETTFHYQEGFLHTDWVLFHRALIAHKDYILCKLLPKYGICAA